MTGKTRSVLQIKFIYIVTTIFLVGLSLYSFVQFNRLFKATRQVNHTHNVKEMLEAISFALLDAASNTRSYTLTGDSLLLERKDRALQSIRESRKVLDSLIGDDSALMQRAAFFNLVVDEKIQSIQGYSFKGFSLAELAVQRFQIEEEVREMEKVNIWLDTLNSEENSMLLQRAQLFSRLSIMAPVYIIVLFLGALIILFYSYFKVYAALAKSHDLHDALVQQSISKESLAAELIITNKALAFQNDEKEKRAAELEVANTELAFQNDEKEKRAAELEVANRELAYQNKEKEKRAAELEVANRELAFQNEEKEKRAAELEVANTELAYQNKEKESKAADLVIANKELAFQNEEREKRAFELLNVNKELELFLNISSHDLQEPLRKIQMAASRIDKGDFMALSPQGRSHFGKMQEGALSMQTLLEDLLAYARAKTEERRFEDVDIASVIQEVIMSLKEVIEEKNAIVEVTASCRAHVIRFQFRQMLHNIITNAIKFSIPGQPPHILITAALKEGSACHNEKLDWDKEYCHIQITDKGIGFEPKYNEKIFEVFQRLSNKETSKGNGIGLSIVKRIVESHNGIVTATGILNEGTTFDVYLPTVKINQDE